MSKITLTEDKLRSIIKNIVKESLEELDYRTYLNAAKEAERRGDKDRVAKYNDAANREVKKQYFGGNQRMYKDSGADYDDDLSFNLSHNGATVKRNTNYGIQNRGERSDFRNGQGVERHAFNDSIFADKNFGTKDERVSAAKQFQHPEVSATRDNLEKSFGDYFRDGGQSYSQNMKAEIDRRRQGK